MPVTVVLELRIKPESVDEVLANMQAELPDTRAFEGNLSVLTVRDQEDPAHLTLIERWQERAHQEKYIAWRQETGSLGRTVAELVSPPTITYYDETEI